MVARLSLICAETSHTSGLTSCTSATSGIPTGTILSLNEPLLGLLLLLLRPVFEKTAYACVAGDA